MLLVCLPLKLLRLTCWPRPACANTLAAGRCCRRWTDCQRLCHCRRCYGCGVRLWAGRAHRCLWFAVHVASTMYGERPHADDTLDAPRCRADVFFTNRSKFGMGPALLSRPPFRKKVSSIEGLVKPNFPLRAQPECVVGTQRVTRSSRLYALWFFLLVHEFFKALTMTSDLFARLGPPSIAGALPCPVHVVGGVDSQSMSPVLRGVAPLGPRRGRLKKHVSRITYHVSRRGSCTSSGSYELLLQGYHNTMKTGLKRHSPATVAYLRSHVDKPATSRPRVSRPAETRGGGSLCGLCRDMSPHPPMLSSPLSWGALMLGGGARADILLLLLWCVGRVIARYVVCRGGWLDIALALRYWTAVRCRGSAGAFDAS